MSWKSHRFKAFEVPGHLQNGHLVATTAILADSSSPKDRLLKISHGPILLNDSGLQYHIPYLPFLPPLKPLSAHYGYGWNPFGSKASVGRHPLHVYTTYYWVMDKNELKISASTASMHEEVLRFVSRELNISSINHSNARSIITIFWNQNWRSHGNPVAFLMPIGASFQPFQSQGAI